jgi:hypothetical protein
MSRLRDRVIDAARDRAVEINSQPDWLICLTLLPDGKAAGTAEHWVRCLQYGSAHFLEFGVLGLAADGWRRAILITARCSASALLARIT